MESAYRRSLKSGKERNSPFLFHRMTGRRYDPVRVAAQCRVAGWFLTTTVSSGSSENSKVGNCRAADPSMEPAKHQIGLLVNILTPINTHTHVKNFYQLQIMLWIEPIEPVYIRHQHIFGLSDMLTNPKNNNNRRYQMALMPIHQKCVYLKIEGAAPQLLLELWGINLWNI